MKTEYVGLDYAHGMANIDKNNGMHYGTISQNEVLQAWVESSEPYYFPACPHCGNEIKQSIIDDVQSGQNKKCLHCKKQLTESDFYDGEPTSYVLDDGEYLAECGDNGDIIITKSPYYSMAQYASPCFPGGGYIMNECETGIKTYCFGHDFFEDGKAPYTVYNVETNEIVKPE
jgi:uncharacterized CHY-type Zn-finger protein